MILSPTVQNAADKKWVRPLGLHPGSLTGLTVKVRFLLSPAACCVQYDDLYEVFLWLLELYTSAVVSDIIEYHKKLKISREFRNES